MKKWILKIGIVFGLIAIPLPSANAVDWTITPWGGFRCEEPGILYINTNYTQALFPSDWIIQGRRNLLSDGIQMTFQSAIPGSMQTLVGFGWGSNSFGVSPNPSLPQYPSAWTGTVTIKAQLVDYVVIDNVRTEKVYGSVVTNVADCTTAGSSYKAKIDKAAADKAAADKAAADKAAADKAAADKAAADKAAADKVGISKMQQAEFDIVKKDYEAMMFRISNLKIKYPNNSNLIGMESKMLKLPIILGDDLSTAKSNIISVTKWLDGNEKVWEKTLKKTITCAKGKVIKKVNGINPKCPNGFKKK